MVVGCEGDNRAVPLIWIIVGQGPVLGAGGGCLDIFPLVYLFFSYSLSSRRHDLD